MEAAINQTIIRCPDYPNAELNVPKLYNPDTFSDPSRLAEIACEAARLPDLWPYLLTTYYFRILFVSSFVGMLSSALALSAYSLKEFQATAFYYYRAINFFDFIYMIYYLCTGSRLTSLATSTPAKFAWEAAAYITRGAAKTAHLLVLWTAFDRAVACTSLTGYHVLDRKRLAVSVISGICLFSLLYDVPFTYYDIQVKYYNGTIPDLALAVTERVLRAIEGLGMLICMIAVITGLLRMSERKRKLLRNNGRGRTSDERGLLDHIRTNQSLCILQLCEGVPFVLVTISVYLSYLTNFLMYYRENANPLVPGGTYEANLSRQRAYVFQKYIAAFLVTAADVYSHSCHFYNYMAFSPKFRRTVLSFVKRWWSATNSAVTPFG